MALPPGCERHPAAKAGRGRVSGPLESVWARGAVLRSPVPEFAARVAFGGNSESGTVGCDVSVFITGSGGGQPHSRGHRCQPCRSAPSETPPARSVSPDKRGPRSAPKRSLKRCCRSAPHASVAVRVGADGIVKLSGAGEQDAEIRSEHGIRRSIECVVGLESRRCSCRASNLSSFFEGVTETVVPGQTRTSPPLDKCSTAVSLPAVRDDPAAKRLPASTTSPITAADGHDRRCRLRG